MKTRLLVPLLLLAAAACEPGPGPDRSADTVGQPATVPTAAVIPTPTILRGTGQMVTQPITPPSALSVVSIGHLGSRNLVVKALAGGRETVLINVLGGYQGQRPLFTQQPVTFDIQADGNWILTVDVIPQVPSALFQGRGDAISGRFEPPAAGPWEISHDGQRGFVVYLHCAGSAGLIQNLIGPTNSSVPVTFGRGPCVWEVQADGNWSLRPGR